MSAKRKKRIYVVRGVLWLIATLGLFIACIAVSHEVPILSIVFLWIGGISLLLLFFYFHVTKSMFNDYEKMEASYKQKQQEAEAIASGKWDFPAQQFYEECNRLGIESADLDTPYSKAKCKVIANELMSKASVPDRHMSLYNTDARLKAYFQQGMEQARKEKLRQEEEKARYKLASHPAELTEEQKEELSFLTGTKMKYGTSKREAMLRQIVERFNAKISDIRTAQENMQKLGVILAQSGYQQRTVDTAVAAGLANGIGGAGAAVYATADAMSRNARIEAENRRNREAVNQFAAGMYSNSFSLSSDIRTLEKQREPYEKALAELRTKVVIEGTDTQELFRSLRIEKPSVEKLESGALSVKASLKTSYRPDVPENVKTTVDGTLTGRVYAGDLYVGECILPLPLYGVECGNPDPTQAETLCGHFAANDKPYRVEFSPNKLWIMEL